MSANDSRNPNCDNIMEGNPIEVYLLSVVIPDIVNDTRWLRSPYVGVESLSVL